jgi:hypothetical protein
MIPIIPAATTLPSRTVALPSAIHPSADSAAPTPPAG